jgi:hypothetical protein
MARRLVSARREIAIGLGAYGSYLLVRRAVWNDRGRARAAVNARRIVDVERALHLDIEAGVQRAALRVPGLVHGLNAGYAAGNVALSVGWLLRLYRRHDLGFVTERRAALITFGGALPFFALFPTAPPRTLDGFVDTLGGHGTGLDHPMLVRLYNPIAAMPSHHVGFAVVTGIGLARRATTHASRVGWLAYPGVVAVVVIATANHFVADVIGGAVIGAVARRVAR